MEDEKKRNLWLIRAYYFMQFGALGFILPFINLFYNRLGISAEHIGILITVGALISVITSLILGAIGGISRNPIRIIQYGLFFSAISQGLISQQTNIFTIGVLVACNAFAIAAVIPLSISLAQDIAANCLGRVGFGSVRLFGSLGWAIVTVGAGWMVEVFGIQSIFVGYVVTAIIAALLMGFIRYLPEHVESKPEGKKFVAETLGLVFKDRALIGFGLAAFLIQAALNGMRQFEPLYMDILGAPESTIGLAFTIAALVEIPFMIWVDRLMGRLNSTNILRISFGLETSRFLLMLFFPTIPMILVGRVIAGISYAFYTIALAQFVLERARLGQNATLQALFNIAIPNLAAIVLTPFIGGLFDRHGGYAIYQVGFVGAIIATFLFLLTVRGTRSKRIGNVGMN